MLIWRNMKKIRVGDLVCYNAGGSKSKTLGFVWAFDNKAYDAKPQVLIEWIIVSKFMPRKGLSEDHNIIRGDIEPGMKVWHDLGNWFELVD